MTYKAKFTKGDHNYVVEVTQEEFEEILEARKAITEAKQKMSDLLELLMKCRPENVHRLHSMVDINQI